MTEYHITGYHYETERSGWFWKWKVTRTEANSNGVVVDYAVANGAEEWRWFATLKGLRSVWSDRYHQRRKNNPIDIRIGGKK